MYIKFSTSHDLLQGSSWLGALPHLVWQFPPERSMFHIQNSPLTGYTLCVRMRDTASSTALYDTEMTNKPNTHVEPDINCPCAEIHTKP